MSESERTEKESFGNNQKNNNSIENNNSIVFEIENSAIKPKDSVEIRSPLRIDKLPNFSRSMPNLEQQNSLRQHS